MMNIQDDIGFDGMRSEDMPEWAVELIGRLESMRQNIMDQLAAQPTVFNVNPDEDPDAVSGNKPGDIAFWIDDTGTQNYRILT